MQTKPSEVPTSSLPQYLADAKPNPLSNRAAWYKNTAPTYAGIFLWFVFWQDAAKSPQLGGLLSQGLGWAVASLIIAALICHFLFYLAPALLGQKTGFPLYIIGTSTFGARGGFLMPGFLMGLLQFGWLAVNIYFSSLALSQVLPLPTSLIMVVWGSLAAFVGLKGIQYVAKVATYLPLIPLAVLAWLLVETWSGLSSFSAGNLITLQSQANPLAPTELSGFQVFSFILTYVIGFFATAGAAGADFGVNSRDSRDVHWGGLVGVGAAIILTAGASLFIVAGAYGSENLTSQILTYARANNLGFILDTFNLIPAILGPTAFKWIAFLLAIASFPPACFSSFIAANCLKTTLPRIQPTITVGIGTLVSLFLALSGWAAKVIPVFVVIGASFGPICGAILADYLLSKRTWAGPRAGFNPAGWLAWALGFTVGILPNWGVAVPAAPLLAFLTGFLVYFLAAQLKLESRPLRF